LLKILWQDIGGRDVTLGAKILMHRTSVQLSVTISFLTFLAVKILLEFRHKAHPTFKSAALIVSSTVA
jgi:hypothetical protein